MSSHSSISRTSRFLLQEEYDQLRNPQLLGGATIGEELCEDGDVYIGGRWNELSVLYLIFLLVPLLGLVFAWATHGTLWDTGVYY
ncbi:hypothetical protein ABPG77_002726 [Micractinium sp. CCAP 211/92]